MNITLEPIDRSTKPPHKPYWAWTYDARPLYQMWRLELWPQNEWPVNATHWSWPLPAPKSPMEEARDKTRHRWRGWPNKAFECGWNAALNRRAEQLVGHWMD